MRRFIENRNGNFAALSALAMLPLAMAAGLAVDYTNLSRERVQLQALADHAVLHAAKLSLTDEAGGDEAIARYLAGADPTGTVRHTFAIVDGEATLSLTRTVPLNFGGIFGMSTTDISTLSHATAGFGGIELALVVDVSGSMKSPRIDSLRMAANKLVDEIYGSRVSIPNVKIALVPFSGRVNVVDYGADWFDAELDSGAVESGKGGGGGGKGKGKGGKSDGGGFTPSATLLCAGLRSGSNDINDAPPSTELFPYFGGEDKVCPGPKMIALVDDRARIQAAITALYPGDGTSTDIGMAWGWRALSPQWQGVWYPENAQLPLSHDETPGKTIVIMTDGKNHPHQSNDPHDEATSNQRLLAQCAAMKAQDYTIYAVTFMMNGTLDSLYRACATSPDHVFDVNSSNDLVAAFQFIGSDIVASSLRLSR
jgi:Flp pilus assembly protein TadG